MADVTFRDVDEAEIGACYELMRQLRPHLKSQEEFIARWRRQSALSRCGARENRLRWPAIASLKTLSTANSSMSTI